MFGAVIKFIRGLAALDRNPVRYLSLKISGGRQLQNAQDRRFQRDVSRGGAIDRVADGKDARELEAQSTLSQSSTASLPPTLMSPTLAELALLVGSTLSQGTSMKRLAPLTATSWYRNKSL